MTAAEIRQTAARLRAGFEAAGAIPVESSILLPAGPLLDLYGEDIRARAYVTSDALRGEQMLRPDFTVPVVLAHVESGAGEGCYTYAGEVFRRQDNSLVRPNEYVQVGFELIGNTEFDTAEAIVFSEIYRALQSYHLRAAIGDIGLLAAVVSGLRTTERRKRALMRHIWRPVRFRALIDRFSGRQAPPASRTALLQAEKPMASDVPLIGMRSREEIAARIEALREDAQTEPLPATEVAALDALLGISAPADRALAELRALGSDLPAISGALDRLEARLAAFSDRGIDIGRLDFEASYGRTQMEYYDGFVFGFYDATNPERPPVASGGRYDALTRHLGQGREIPAVGGVIRPDLLNALMPGNGRGGS
ncbi:MAG: ATP phosphoribosyltransferase regulatory subunit [Pseudomonadota bacterium]